VSALRSLVARGLIEDSGDGKLERAAAEGAMVSLRPFGELESILAVRRAPSAVVFVGQASCLAALHGFREERIDRRGLPYFTLLTAAQAVEAVAALVRPGTVSVVRSAFGVAPDRPWFFA
jgi:hypothetical protein